MAKLQDKFFNRVIEGDLEVGANDKIAPEAVASAIAGGDVDNAKPIYCHPLTIRVDVTISGNAYVAELCALIFNNSQSEINNKDKLFEAISNFKAIASTSKVLLVSGALASSGEGAFYMSARSITLNTTNNKVFIEGIDNTGTRHTTESNVIEITNGSFNYVYDAVNKIN